MPGKKRSPAIEPTIQAAHTTSRRALIGSIVAAVITVAGGIIIAVINGWFGNRKPPRVSEIYRVRVTILDPQGTPTEEAKVWSSFDFIPKKVAGGWQIDIPAAAKPKEGSLTIFASKENDFLNGTASLTLTDDFNPTVIVHLKRDDSAKVRGQVVDDRGNAIADVRVWIVGYGGEGVVTQTNGNFELPAHASPNQPVRLHAEKAGYKVTEQYHPAGSEPANLVLLR